ncbi:hypothetical protein BCV70DRAFT_120588 [Testicularia cyperi]|uniref:DNA endonuclease activator Ctp1 C-terminal domain-containing protein n=1 Tax=Testicularia cyperi TaxID=1882483 RepID=A0A317XQK2_9BASI|nr:hypothetical protein BCV70DRAFT_120588 [Testicularia cyperi]
MSGAKRKRPITPSDEHDHGSPPGDVFKVLGDAAHLESDAVNSSSLQHLREQIGTVLRSAQTQIDSLIASRASASATLVSASAQIDHHVLRPMTAPPQAPSSPKLGTGLTSRCLPKGGQLAPDPILQRSSQSDRTCDRCVDLRRKVSELEKQAKRHEQERRAWKEFKAWWLDSLEKRDRRKHKKLNRKERTHTSTRQTASPCKAATSTCANRSTDTVSQMLNNLDDRTKLLWQRAGIASLPSGASDAHVPVAVVETAAPGQAVDSCWAAKTPESSEMALAVRPNLAGSGGAASQSPSDCSRPPRDAAARKHVTAPASSLQPDELDSFVFDSQMDQIPTKVSMEVTAPDNLPALPAVGHIDDVPERSKFKRRAMLAHDCPDCVEFYVHFNDATGHRAAGQAERQACSRHRSTHQRPLTPPGYWNIGFPTTQDADEINQRARQQHRS